MTIEELIQRLEELRDEHGPHIEVGKRGADWQWTGKPTPIKDVRVEDSDEDPANWTISL